MKTLLAFISLLLSLFTHLAHAGAMAGGASEVTQIMNNIQLMLTYEQQTEQLISDGMRLESMLKNLKDHPMGYVAPNLNAIASNMGRVISASKDIGNTMARVDQNFATQFKSPMAGTFADKFKSWTSHSTDALKAAMLTAGVQRENFGSDTAALQKMVANNQASDGALSAAKTLGTINAAQVQELIKLRELLTQQQLAANTHILAQGAKETEEHNNQMNLATPYTKPIPNMETMKILDWNKILRTNSKTNP